MKITAIVQARMNSSRLPGKVLMDINGKTSLERMIERITKSKLLNEIIIATTQNKEDFEIIKQCKFLGLKYFAGEENDVLDRFFKASQKFNVKNIVRLTADCPMHDHEVIDSIIQIYKNNNYDYVSNVIKRTFPDGLDVEVFNFESLYKAQLNAENKIHREHVTTYMRGRLKGLESGNFKIFNVENDIDLSSFRWTLDNENDLENIRFFYKNLPKDFSWNDAVQLEIFRKKNNN
jgi:spore coat polysaccharide biosynthesis protein SpsF